MGASLESETGLDSRVNTQDMVCKARVTRKSEPDQPHVFWNHLGSGLFGLSRKNLKIVYGSPRCPLGRDLPIAHVITVPLQCENRCLNSPVKLCPRLSIPFPWWQHHLPWQQPSPMATPSPSRRGNRGMAKGIQKENSVSYRPSPLKLH